MVKQEKPKSSSSHAWDWNQFYDYLEGLDDYPSTTKSQGAPLIEIDHESDSSNTISQEEELDLTHDEEVNNEADQAFISGSLNNRPLTPEEVILGENSPVQDLSEALASIPVRPSRERKKIDYKRLHKLGWK